MSLRAFFVRSAVAAGLAALAATPANAAGTVHVTYEAPGVEHTTLSFLTVVETFNELATKAYSSAVTTAVGTYTGLTVKPNDVWAGTGGIGAGAYSAVAVGQQTTLKLSQPSTYFGLWFAAQDTANEIDFRKDGQVVFAFTGDQMRSDLTKRAYYGNPDSLTGGKRDNKYEPYAFVNFQAAGGLTFDEVDIKQNCGCGTFETDNHTVAAAPEPAIWVLMILGVGGMGAALRTRRRRMAA